MLRPLYLPIISFCILLTASKCSDGCQTPNLLGDQVTELKTAYIKLGNENAELRKQFDELADQRDAIFQATQDLNKALQDLEKLNALKEELEQKLAELQTIRAPQQEIEEIKQQLQEVKNDIVNKEEEITKLKKAVKTAQSTADTAKAKADTVDNIKSGLQGQITALQTELRTQYATLVGLDAIWGKIGVLETQINGAATKAQTKHLQEQIDILRKGLQKAATKEELQKEKEELRLKITGLEGDINTCVKKADFEPVKKTIEGLKNDLEAANKKLGQAATKDELKQAKKELENKIAGVQKNLTTAQKEFGEGIKNSKKEALQEANRLAQEMIKEAKKEMEQALATKQELKDAIAALKSAQEGKSTKDQEQLQALEAECRKLHTQIDANEKHAQQELAKIQDHANRIGLLEKDWNAGSKAKLEEADRKAKEELDKLQKAATTSQPLDKKAIQALLEDYIQEKEKAEKIKLGFSGQDSIQAQALELAQKSWKELQALALQLSTVSSSAAENKKTLREMKEDREKKEKKGPAFQTYEWTNGTAKSLIETVIELQDKIKLTGIKLQKDIKVSSNQQYIGYEERLNQLEATTQEIKDKEQTAQDLGTGISKLIKLLESFKRGSFKITSPEGAKTLTRSHSQTRIELEFENKTLEGALENLKKLQE